MYDEETGAGSEPDPYEAEESEEVEEKGRWEGRETNKDEKYLFALRCGPLNDVANKPYLSSRMKW